ncbi:MAG: DUF169 domain-containing protein [Peptococcaceae bacterium]|nr:DUF169 domain-containing protein [Peptococcaceae bacterium]
MESKIAQAIGMKYAPVAVIFTDDKPEQALQFKEGKWGCVVSMLNAAAKGKTTVFDRKTFGCLGGGTGLGFGNQYANFPGGIENFVSTGNQEFAQSDFGKNVVRNMPAIEHGERYVKSPLLAKQFFDSLPMRDVPAEFIVFKPLDKVAEQEIPKVIIFLVNPDQLSALVVMANYGREGNESAIIPFGAGCHTVCLIPYHEDDAALPRAVVGLVDISARKQVDKDILSFSVPYKMFTELESNVVGSFLEQEVWQNVLERNRVE